MARLTNDYRRQLLVAITRRTYQPKFEELLQEGKELADRVYNSVYPKKDRELMESLPSGWVPESDCVALNMDGELRCIYWNGSLFGPYAWKAVDRMPHPFDRPNDLERRIAYKHIWGRGRAQLKENAEEIRKDLIEFNDKLENLRDEYFDAWRRAEAVLNSVSTVGKLLKIWPEIAEFVPEEWYCPRKANLPSLPIAQLNEILDLPPEEK